MNKLPFLLLLCITLVSCVTLIDQPCRERNHRPEGLNPGHSRSFFVSYSSTCNPSGILFETNKKYVFKNYSVVTPIADGEITQVNGSPLSLKGWQTSDACWWQQPGLALAGLFRPKSDADWYVLLGKLINNSDDKELGAFFSISDYYYSKRIFTPDKSGHLYVIANDLPCCGRYKNNKGVVIITVECQKY